ncbi:MAG: ATP-binding protein, partial [Bacteroidota bacterium]|nr:ATP-binding protein [Bacteroidota bacterium]
KKLNWVTVKTGAIRPDVKKLDIDALPSTPYDASGFKPLPNPPKEVHFDFNRLPDSAFDMDMIPSQSLRFKTSVLAPPVFVKASPPSPKSGTIISILEIARAQGLPEKVVFCLLKDKNGLIWIGTDKGIYRYDGEYMWTYANFGASGLIEDAKGKIWYINNEGIGMIDPLTGIIRSSNRIRTIFPQLPKMILDEKGNIWICRISDFGVAVINPQNLSYQHIDNGFGVSKIRAWGVFEDEKKSIWVTTTKGINIINRQKKRISYLRMANGLNNDTTYAITGDHSGKLWIAYRHGGVSEVDPQKGIIKNYGILQGFDNGLGQRILIDNNNNIWIAADNGLSILNPDKGLAKHFSDTDGIPENYILDLLPDEKQRVWVATYTSGLSIIDQDARMVYPVGKKNISTLFEDAKGNIWVGTTSEGIDILNSERKADRKLNKQTGFSDNFIQSFFEENGKIWVTSDGGLDIIDQKHKTIEHTGKKEGLMSDTVYAVLKDARGNIWLTGPSQGIQIIDSAKTSIRRAWKMNGLSDNNILSIKQDKQGKVWIATYVGGVDIIDPETMTIQYLNNAPGLKDTCYRDLMPDKYGRMWIGTDKGIYVADTKQGTLTSISTREGLSNDYISSMNEYNENVVVGTHNKANIIIPPITTNNGVANMVQGKWKVSRLAKSEGLILGNNAWDVNIVTKEGQYLWGDAGITIINDLKEEHDSAYTVIAGLNIMSQTENFANDFSINANDTLWYTDSFYLKGQNPVNTGYVQQGRFRWDSVSGPYNMPVNLHVPYNQNYIQFQFGQKNLGRQDAVIYSYILEGIDKKWSTFSTKSFTDNYLNLPAGKYTFRVRSKALSGLWTKSADFSFVITPPWYNTWWAYTLFTLLAIGILRAYIVYRSGKLKRENKILEEKVEHRTNQLKQSLEDLKATQSQLIQSEKMASLGELTAGIAHEIQNPLNFINNFSEVNKELLAEMNEEIQKGNYDEVKSIAKDVSDNEEKINHHGKRADAIVKGMLQHSRTSSGQKELTDINSLCDEYLRLSYHGLRAKDKSFNAKFETDFDKSIGMVNVIPQDFGRVILNLINNAFYAVAERKKNSADNYEPTVTISTKKSDKKIEIRVNDNGNGIPQKVIDKIFQPFFTTKPAGEGTGLGLSLSYDIIRVHGGELNVETQESKGTSFLIILPV